MFKKTTLAVLGIVVSNIAAAGTMGPVCSPGNVTVPCELSAWEFGATALYLQPVLNSDMTYYGYDIAPADPTQTLSFHALDHWNWGFKIDAAYHIQNGSDVALNWHHLTSNHEYYPQFPEFNNSRNKFRWDSVSLELGQMVDFSANQKIRFHGGLNYSRITTDRMNRNPVLDSRFLSSFDSYFNGIGPRVGVDLNYGLANGLGVYAKTGTSLLLGNASFHQVVPASTYNLDPIGPYVETGKRNPVVPELDIKLGGNYKYAMATGSLILDAGWMWASYFQAQHGNIDNSDSNFSVSGPYVGLNYVGNL